MRSVQLNFKHLYIQTIEIIQVNRITQQLDWNNILQLNFIKTKQFYISITFRSIVIKKIKNNDKVDNSFKMYLQAVQQQLTFNQLILELKTKSKQINFLQDKILLMQRQKQIKTSQIQPKFLFKIQRLQQTNNLLGAQNQQLRLRVQKYKHKINGLNQRQKNLTSQINLLTQSQTNTTKQSKIYKCKYQKQKRQAINLDEQNITLKSMINMMEKQMNQLNHKNIKLIQGKNMLMNTYNDYDQIEYKLEQIQEIYNDQYENQVDLIKKRMKNQLEENTRQIVKEIGRQKFELKVINEPGKKNKNMKQLLYLKNQKIQQKLQFQQKQSQIQAVSRETLKHGKSSDKLLNKSKECKVCEFQQSWTQDVIKLQNVIKYGQEYILSLSNYQSHQQPRNSQNKPSAITFTHLHTQKIFTFITSLVQKNIYLDQQLRKRQKQNSQVKKQFQQKMNMLIEEVERLQADEREKNRLIGDNQIKEKQKKQKIQKDISKMVTMQQNVNKSMRQSLIAKKITSVLIQLTAKIINKYHQVKHKIKFVQLFNHRRQTANYSNKGLNLFKYKENQIKGKLQRSASRLIKESSDIKISLKLKSVMLATFFIQILRRSSSKLRRKVNLSLGIKPLLSINLMYRNSSLKSQRQLQQNHEKIQKNDIASKQNISLSELSTYQLILNHYQQMYKQSKVANSVYNHQNKIGSIHHKSPGTDPTIVLLKNCLYQIKKQSVLSGRIKKRQNLQLKNWFSKVQQLDFLHLQNCLYYPAIQIILQQQFIQQTSASKSSAGSLFY